MKIKDYIDEEVHTKNIGGSKSGETLTSYGLTIYKIKKFLFYQRKWRTVDEILSEVETHYRNPKPSTADTLKAHWNEHWIEHKIINGKSHFKMREDYREIFKNELMNEIMGRGGHC